MINERLICRVNSYSVVVVMKDNVEKTVFRDLSRLQHD